MSRAGTPDSSDPTAVVTHHHLEPADLDAPPTEPPTEAKPPPHSTQLLAHQPETKPGDVEVADVELGVILAPEDHHRADANEEQDDDQAKKADKEDARE